MQAALRKISERMPDFLESGALEDLLGEEMIDAWSGEAIRNNGTREGAIKGWETRRRNGWVPAPKLISPEQADELLKKGFSVKSQAGEDIHFDHRLRNKLNNKIENLKDRDARKARIHWARLAVKEGKSEPSNRNGEKRTIYSKTFRRGSAHKNLEVIVDTINGYAWNIMIKKGGPDDVR